MPESSYFICGTPRSGSTLLATLLDTTGLVGYAGEFFSRANEPDWAASDYARFVSEVVGARTVRGIFGAKLFPDYLVDLLARLRGLSGHAGLNDRRLLESVFPRPRYLWIRRSDVVAQAVSWWKAAQTGEYYSGDPRRRADASLCFDFDEIHRLVRELREGDERWQRWFSGNGVEPLPILYEHLVEDKVGAAKLALGFIGVAFPPGTRVTERISRQADAVNEEWIARYHELAAGRGIA